MHTGTRQTAPAAPGGRPIPRVLISDAPKHGESLHGYLVRMAERNVFESPSWFLSMCGEKFISARTDRVIPKLARVLRRSVPELRSLGLFPEPKAGPLGVRFLSSAIHGPLVDQTRSKICPLCLAEDPYLRLLWELRPLTCCPHHGARLVWQCPACREPLRYKRAKVYECTCGQDLREIAPDAADSSELCLSRLLEAKATGAELASDGCHPDVRRLSLNDLSRLVAFLGCYSGGNRIEKRAVIYQRGPSEWSKVALAGAQVLHGWPQCFKGYLDDLRHRHEKGESQTRLTGAFSRFYRHATLFFDAPQYEFFLREFAEYINTFWPHGKIRSRNTRLRHLIVDDRRRIHGSEAMKMLGVSRDQLIEMIENGKLTGTVARSGRRVWIFVEAESLERFKSMRVARLSLKQARRRLSVSMRVAAAMADAGLLEELFGTRRRGRIRYVSEESVQKIIGAFVGSRSARVPRASDPISLGWAMQFVPGGVVWVPKLVKAVVAGRVRPLAETFPGAGLCAFGFERRSLMALTAEARRDAEQPLALYEAARIFGVRDEIMYLLADAGLFECVASNDGRRARFVTRPEVERLKARYARASELGRCFGVSAAMVRKRLREGGVTPAFHRTGRNHAFYLFDRGKAEAMLLRAERRVPDGNH